MDIPHFVYPSTYQWRFALFPLFGYCDQCCRELMGVKCLFTVSALNYLGYMLGSGIAESYGNCTIFCKATTLSQFFYNGCSIVYPTSNAQGFQFLHILTNTYFFFLPFFFIITLLLGVKWHCIVVLICSFLTITDVKHLLVCLLTI